jgi:hypothetical protein
MSWAGIVPRPVTTTVAGSCARSSSTTRGTSVMWAPERIETPIASASSWMAGLDDLLGVWCRPV